MKNQIVKIANKMLSNVNAKIVSLNNSLDLSAYEEETRPSKPKYINIGAGMWHHPLWHNLDNPSPGYGKSYGPKDHFDSLIQHDLMSHDEIKIDSNSLKCIFTSHTIEHIDDAAVDRLLRESYRMLKPGGYLRIVCPDIDLFLDAYFRKDTNYLVKTSQKKNDFSQDPEQMLISQFGAALSTLVNDCGVEKVSTEEFKSKITEENKYDLLDEYISTIPEEVVAKYPRNHDSWWTEEKLIKKLNALGFTESYSTRFGQSHASQMRDTNLFDTTHTSESLYIEARK